MSIIGANGFEAGNIQADGLIGYGSPAFQPFGTPPGSASTYRCAIGNSNASAPLRQPWVNGEQAGGTPREPSGNTYWWQMRVLLPGGGSTIRRFGAARGGTPGVQVNVEADETVQIYVGGNARGAASTFTVTINVWHTFHVFVNHIDGGDVEVYVDGDLVNPIATYTLDEGGSSDLTNMGGKPNEFWWNNNSNSSQLIFDDCFALDPNDATGVVDIEEVVNASFQQVILDGNGFYQQQVSGDYLDLDEIPFSDADYIDFNNTNLAATFTIDNAAQPAVHFVQTKARITRTGTDAGSNLQMRLRSGGTDKDETTTVAPGAGYIIQQHHTAADAGAWDATKFNATEIGLITRT
jgi:hypothetical protein